MNPNRPHSAGRIRHVAASAARIGATVALLILCVSTGPASAAPGSTAAESVVGTWRVITGVVAPWVPADRVRPDARRWIGTAVSFDGPRVSGLGVLDSADAEYELLEVPAEGLFQGNLPTPAGRAATALGIPAPIDAGTETRGLPNPDAARRSEPAATAATYGHASPETPGASGIPTVRMTASSGLFDFHRLDANTLLVALDEVIWTLGRSAGTNAPPASPAGIVERWLEAHFAGDLGFRPGALQAGRMLLSPALAAEIAAYFRDYLPQVPADEVPLIDGDPFTDSQEYPTRFEVLAPVGTEEESRVPVIFHDAFVERRVTFVLRPVEGHWRIDDLAYESDGTLRQLLRTALEAVR